MRPGDSRRRHPLPPDVRSRSIRGCSFLDSTDVDVNCTTEVSRMDEIDLNRAAREREVGWWAVSVLAAFALGAALATILIVWI